VSETNILELELYGKNERGERRLSEQCFEIVSEEVAEKERRIGEESHDYKLKITVAVAESPVHMINRWNMKILERVKPQNLVKCGGKRTSRPL